MDFLADILDLNNNDTLNNIEIATGCAMLSSELKLDEDDEEDEENEEE